MDNFIQAVLEGNWTDVGSFVEQRAAEQIKTKLDNKKSDIINRLNKGISEE